MEHRTSVVELHTGWAGRCTCKAKGPSTPAYSAAEDWGYRHLVDVERTRAHLRDRAPSIKDQYDYYRQMEHDSATVPHEAALWKILADGLEHRLGLPHTEEALF